jgi:hypothetical protein
MSWFDLARLQQLFVGKSEVLRDSVSPLPTNGSTIYVTLYSQVNGTWVEDYYSYGMSPDNLVGSWTFND